MVGVFLFSVLGQSPGRFARRSSPCLCLERRCRVNERGLELASWTPPLSCLDVEQRNDRQCLYFQSPLGARKVHSGHGMSRDSIGPFRLPLLVRYR